MNCSNCFLPIKDGRKAVRCSVCNNSLHKDCAIKEDEKSYCDVCYTLKNDEKSKTTKSNIVVPDVIRRSHIETYRDCPYKFYLEVIKDLPVPPTIYTQVGIDLHELFDKACNDKSYRIVDMKKDFKNIWNNYDEKLFDTFYGDKSKEEQTLKMYNHAFNSINTFYNVLTQLPRKPHTTETQIIYSIGNDLPKISITSDRTDIIDGMIEMCDWKTGQVIVGKRLSTDLQAPLYIKAVEDKYNMLVRKFTFYFLESGKVREFIRSDKNDEFICTVKKRKYIISPIEAVREVQRIFSQIKKGNFNIPRDTSKMYFTCKICPFKANNTCLGASMESWRQYNKGVS